MTGDDRPEVEDILIVFTDGATRDQRVAVKYADKMKQRGVHIIGIAAGSKREDFKGQLEEIASSPDDLFMVEFDQLQDVIHKLVNKVCKAPPSKYIYYFRFRNNLSESKRNNTVQVFAQFPC